MVKIPETNIDFVVTPEFFLAPFDVYDREETLGEELNKYDPNNSEDLAFLFGNYIFCGDMFNKFDRTHKEIIIDCLSKILDLDDDKVRDVVLSLSDLDEPIFLPSKWQFDSPRFFFSEALKYIQDLELMGSSNK